MTDVPAEGQVFEVPVVWIGVEEMPFLTANQFIGQIDRGEVLLTIGHVAPPPLMGTLEERQEQLRQLDVVAVRPVARLAMTPSRLEELIGVLNTVLENYHRGQEQDKKPGQPG